ncbi:MAG: cytochrome c maturation protein CcmE [Myxococcaceae bacterium]
MSDTTNRNRVLALGAILVAMGALATIAYSNIGDNLVYYWTPTELLAAGEKAYGPTIRLGGLVAKGSLVPGQTKPPITFKVVDSPVEGAPTVTVTTEEIPPQMFREGIGVVVEGTYDKTGVFKGSRLMVKHDNQYRVPDGGADEWKKSLEGVSQK